MGSGLVRRLYVLIPRAGAAALCNPEFRGDCGGVQGGVECWGGDKAAKDRRILVGGSA